jgi:hypothetical protein
MASNDYDLPKIPGVVSMTKVKNALKSVRPGLIVKISNVRVNGQLQGCSGLITDPATGHVVYISTDVNHGTSRGALYREAKHDRDYTGGQNHFCPHDEIVQHALDLLDRAPARV